jgi:hypothetical protein
LKIHYVEAAVHGLCRSAQNVWAGGIFGTPVRLLTSAGRWIRTFHLNRRQLVLLERPILQGGQVAVGFRVKIHCVRWTHQK